MCCSRLRSAWLCRLRLTLLLRWTRPFFKVRYIDGCAALSTAACSVCALTGCRCSAALSPLVNADSSATAPPVAASFVPESVRQADRPHIAELFRLAYVARDLRLAPKRAKNARQRERREKARTTDAAARSLSGALASLHRKDLLPADGMAGLCICDS